MGHTGIHACGDLAPLLAEGRLSALREVAETRISVLRSGECQENNDENGVGIAHPSIILTLQPSSHLTGIEQSIRVNLFFKL